MSPSYHAALVGLVALLGACAAVGPAQADVLVLEVGPQTVACTGEAPQRCLRVRRPGESEWTNFYDPIEGFTHEAGVRYRIEVERTRVPHPPADASSFRYRLLRVLEREAVSGG